MAATTILLARHGETDWNRERRFQGHADRPLNTTGRAQARQLAGLLAREPVTAIYSSDLERAHGTALIVSRTLGAPVVTVPALREIDVGTLEGLTYPEVVARWPDLRDREAGLGFAWAGGETFDELARRVLDALDRIARDHPRQTVLTVGHGAMMRVVLARARGLTVAEHREVVAPIANTAVERIEVDAGGNLRMAAGTACSPATGSD